MSAGNLPLVAVVVFSACAAIGAAEPAGRLVHVSGQGVVEAAPDQVVVQATVTTVDDDLIRVRENSDKDARTILNSAKKHGADEKDFHVSRLQLSLDFNEQLRRQIYKVERDVTVKLGDLSKLDPLLLDLLREPNLKVKGIAFTTSKARQYEFDALRRAVADAREKAQHLAELNGLKLGKARDIRVGGESQTPFVMSVVPVVGAAERKPKQGDTARDAGRAAGPFAKGKPQAGNGFYFVAAERAGTQREAGIADARPFALGLIAITADVEMEFELGE